MGIFDRLRSKKIRKTERIIPDVIRERIESGRGQGEDEVPLLGGQTQEISQKTVTRSGKPDTPPQRDPGKRQRIFVVAAAIVLFVFGMKVWGKQDWSVTEVILIACASAVLTYLGLMWAFRFEISRKGYIVVLTQPALFVFGYVLFVEMFFFQQFERIYEALIFGGLLIVFMAVLGIVFLTANVLNVATFKDLPLLQVAQTSSYAITLFSVFFIPFFIASLGWNFALTFGMLLCVYLIATVIHLMHFSINVRTVFRISVGISWTAAMAAAVLLLWPVPTLFRVLLPAVIVYVGVGIVMHDVRKALRPLLHWEYAVLLLFVVIVLLSRAVWGISGYAWM